MEQLILKAKPRSLLGKKVKNLRKTDFIPGVVYGYGMPNIPVSVKYKDFENVYRKAGQSSVITIELENGEPSSKKVFIYDISNNPVDDSFIHVDFYQARADKKVKVDVPLVFIGVSEAEKSHGAIIVKNMHKVEVEALPDKIPHEINVDLSLLKKIDDNIYGKDIKVLSGARILVSEDQIIVSATPPRSEKELESLKEAVVENVAEVKVIKEEKKKEEAAEEEEKNSSEKK